MATCIIPLDKTRDLPELLERSRFFRESDNARYCPPLTWAYADTFLLPAHNYDFCRETRAYPRPKDYQQGRPSGLQRASRLRGIFKNKQTGEEIRAYLPRLSAGLYKSFLLNLTYREGSRYAKWFHAKYDSHRAARFVQFDFDLHIKKNDTERDRELMRGWFWETIREFESVVQRVRARVEWTTSPGTMIDGQWCHGLYAWVKILPVKVWDLRTAVSRWLMCHGLQARGRRSRACSGFSGVECCWQRMDLVRLPGQPRVWSCSVDSQAETVEVFEPRPDQLDRLRELTGKNRNLEALSNEWKWHLFNWRWDRLPVSTGLFELPSVKQARWPVDPRVVPARPRSVQGTDEEPYSYSRHSLDELQAMPDAFEAFQASGEWQRLAHKYRGDMGQLHAAFQEAMLTFQEVRPEDSDYRRDMARLESVVRSGLAFYFSNYDPAKGARQERRWMTTKERADDDRIAYCLGLDRDKLLSCLREEYGLDEAALRFIGEFYEKVEGFRGRIAGEILFELAGSQRQWCKPGKLRKDGTRKPCLRDRLMGAGIICELRGPDNAARSCTQWGLSPELVGRLREPSG